MGFYIAFEGIFKSGKSSQIDLVHSWFLSQKKNVNTFTEVPQKLLDLLNEWPERDDRIDGLGFILSTLLTNKNIGKLPKDHIVLCEYSFLASLAYQTIQRDENINEGMAHMDILRLHDIYPIDPDGGLGLNIVYVSNTFIFPHLVIIYDVSVKEAFRRGGSETKEKWDNPDVLKIAREKYIKLYRKRKQFPFEIALIETDGKSIDEVFEITKKVIEKTMASEPKRIVDFSSYSMPFDH